MNFMGHYLLSHSLNISLMARSNDVCKKLRIEMMTSEWRGGGKKVSIICANVSEKSSSTIARLIYAKIHKIF
jgi:hypothetical protein